MSKPTDDEHDEIRLTATALHSLQTIPPRVTEPLVAFIFGSLAENPRRRGKPLQRELAAHWSARRGDYRVLYSLDEDTKLLYVHKVAHRSEVYRT